VRRWGFAAFVRLRRLLATHRDLAKRLEEHERKLARHDQAIAGLMSTIRSLLEPTAAAEAAYWLHCLLDVAEIAVPPLA
jgi:hypothetical protein